MKEMKDFINELIKQGKKVNENMFRYFASQTRNFDEVKVVIECLREYGWKPGKKVYRLLMQLAENHDDSRAILNDMRKRKITPNWQIYMELIDTSQNNSQARQVIEEMKEVGIEISPVMYGILLKKQSSYIEARKILEDMKYRGLYISDICYYNLMSKADNEKDVKDIIDEMANSNMKFDIESYSKIKNFDRKARAEELRKIISRGSLYEEFNISKNIISGNMRPNKKRRNIQETERDYVLVNYLKNMYDDRCQICGEKLNLGGNKFYSEVHHIQPLSCEGPDILDNMIVVCPNHHKLFDRGAITIDVKNDKIKHKDSNDIINKMNLVLKHYIDEEYVDHHNFHIFTI